jgi:hypothetical protein
MVLGIVEGTITSNQNSFDIPGGRYLLINKCNQAGKIKNEFLIALDLVSAGKNEMVMILKVPLPVKLQQRATKLLTLLLLELSIKLMKTIKWFIKNKWKRKT